MLHTKKDVVEKIATVLKKAFGKRTGLSTTTSKAHGCLGMTLGHSQNRLTVITMFDHLQDTFLANVPDSLNTAANHPFHINEDTAKLNKEGADAFHCTVAQLPFAAKGAWPDMHQTAIAFLCTWVKSQDEDGWKKPMRELGHVTTSRN